MKRNESQFLWKKHRKINILTKNRIFFRIKFLISILTLIAN